MLLGKGVAVKQSEGEARMRDELQNLWGPLQKKNAGPFLKND